LKRIVTETSCQPQHCIGPLTALAWRRISFQLTGRKGGRGKRSQNQEGFDGEARKTYQNRLSQACAVLSYSRHPTLTRHLTGDPLPGRSALDQIASARAAGPELPGRSAQESGRGIS
jgi:hypothetical protein